MYTGTITTYTTQYLHVLTQDSIIAGLSLMLIPESFFEDWNIFQIIGQLDVEQPHHTQSSGDPERGGTSLPKK